MADEEDVNYNNIHRAFLQSFVARSTFSFDEAKPVLAAIFGAREKREYNVEDVTEADFNHYVTVINSAISPYDLEIRSTFHQKTRERKYALVNSTSDPFTQLATIHGPDEISYVKRLLDTMFETYNTRRHEVMAITSMQAVGLAKAPQNGAETQGSAGQSLTLMQAERMLKTLVEEGWFERSKKGFYSLTPRALMELRGWLIEMYNEDEGEDEERVIRIKQCFACKEIITTGQRCPNRSCQCRLHDICTQRFFTTQKARKCPLCKNDWTGNDYVGERAAMNMKEKTKRKSTNDAPARRRSSAFANEEEEEQDETEGDDPG